MNARAKFALRIVGLLSLLALGVLCTLLIRNWEWPGGMSSSYRAKDNDPRLTTEARKARTLIAALVRFHQEHGRFPERLDALSAALPAADEHGHVLSTNMFNGWHYNMEEDGRKFQLYYKLGWDPALFFHHDGAQGRWVFDPGDGQPEKEILLSFDEKSG